MTRRRRAGLAVLSFAAAAAITAGCTGDDDVADMTVAAPTTEETTTTTMEATTTVAETTTSAPPTTTTTTTSSTTDATATAPPSSDPIDWKAIAEDVYARKDALLAAPDASRVAEVAQEGSTAFDSLLRQTTNYLASGWHLEVSPWSAARVDLVSVDVATVEGEPRVVRLTAWVVPAEGRGTVDADGNVVAPLLPLSVPPGTLPRLSIGLARETVESPWRLVDETSMPPETP